MDATSLWPPHRKPEGCRGCPREAIGRGFVPGYGTLTAPLVVIGEQPGGNEVVEGKPFVGPSGRELDEGLGSLGRSGTFITNVRKCLGPVGETPAERAASIAHCVAAYLQPEMDALNEAKTVLAIGNDALAVAVGAESIVRWHGSVVSREERDAIVDAHVVR